MCAAECDALGLERSIAAARYRNKESRIPSPSRLCLRDREEDVRDKPSRAKPSQGEARCAKGETAAPYWVRRKLRLAKPQVTGGRCDLCPQRRVRDVS
jgi:hypothetical protein